MPSDIKKLYNLVKNKDERSLTKQAIVNSSYSFLTSIISRVGALIFTILLARALMPELFGVYNLVLSLILTIVTFTDLGINSAMIRYLADSLGRGKRNEKEARSRFKFLFNLKIILAFGIALILFLLSPIIANSIFSKPELILPLQIGSLYIFVVSIQGFIGSLFFTLNKLKYNLFSEIIFQALRIFLFFAFVQLYREVSTVFWILTISYGFSLLFYFLMLLIKRRSLLFGKTIVIDRRNIAIFLGWTIILSTSLVLFTNINTFMLGLFVENKYLGYYSTILSIVGTIMGFIAFSGIFLPIFTQISGDRLDRGFKKTIKYALMIAIPVSLGLIYVITPAIRIIYGAEYSPFGYYMPLFITSIFLCLLIIESVFTGMYNSLFMAKEKVKYPAILLVIATTLNLILNYFFIKFALPYGQEWTLVAVASATFLTRYANLGILGILAKKQLNLIPQAKDIIKPLIAALIMLGFLYLCEYWFNPGLWVSILIVILAAGIYFLSLIGIRKI